ncbi:hypothetical protein [Asticcacaulis sp. MM231]|uniref:hypothetical protein n=1 Tax=Asticcacaulis sp. MM231 TaxID=3157666 RepID=UPI0032D5A15B
MGIFLLAAPASFASETPEPQANALAYALKDRVGPPHPDTIAAYVQAGATETKAHELTDREWALVEQAINSLPPLHQRILEKHLARLSFIEAPASVGTALTRMYEGPNGEPLFDITIRADILDASLSYFLTQKESTLFSDDSSGLSVQVIASEAPALPYLLLHEASHVVDRSLGLTRNSGSFGDMWKDYRELAEPYAQGPLAQSVYRRAPRLPAAKSTALYAALARSPFVSLYSTASAGEDFAELAAWSTLSQRDKIPLIFEVRDRNGQVIIRVEPLKQVAVQARLRAVDAQLSRP